MPPARIADDRDWLVKHLQPLMEAGRRLVSFDRELPARLPTYDRGYWTGLKLIALKYYLPTYLNILAQKTRVGYVDLFAGPGLNRIGKRKVAIPGSPLVPLMIHETAAGRSFSHVFFCEKDRESFTALRRRVLEFAPSLCGKTVFSGDANHFVRNLPDLVEENEIGHCLVFVDPEGLEWWWESMEFLVGQVNCDIIVNFPSAGLQRISTRQDPSTRQTIARFLGLKESELPNQIDGEWAIERYRRGLAAMGKNISTEIKITDVGSFHYHLIPAVRETSSGTPWFQAFITLRDRVEKLHGDILNMVAQQVDGKLGTLR